MEHRAIRELEFLSSHPALRELALGKLLILRRDYTDMINELDKVDILGILIKYQSDILAVIAIKKKLLFLHLITI